MKSILFAELSLTEQETLRGGKDNATTIIYNINNISQSQSQSQQQQQQPQGFLTTTTTTIIQELI